MAEENKKNTFRAFASRAKNGRDSRSRETEVVEKIAATSTYS